MATPELHPPEFGAPLTTCNTNTNTNSLSSPSLPQAQPIPPPPHSAQNPTSTLAPKRHRRPSVRLGDIGDPPATSLRTSKSWKLNPNQNPYHSSKTRPLTNLNGYSSADNHHQRKFSKEFKSKKPSSTSKKARTNLLIINQKDEDEDQLDRVKGDTIINNNDNINNNDFNEFDNDDEDGINHNNEGFRDYDPDIDGPDGPDQDQEQSPINSDDVGGNNLDMWNSHNRRSNRVTRVSLSNQDVGAESNSRYRGGLDDGVRKWLDELALARYAPVFEIHEVDEEVLPYLTLDDLTDMGINAVGSRRKLYFAIQKLRKGMS